MRTNPFLFLRIRQLKCVYLNKKKNESTHLYFSKTLIMKKKQLQLQSHLLQSTCRWGFRTSLQDNTCSEFFWLVEYRQYIIRNNYIVAVAFTFVSVMRILTRGCQLNKIMCLIAFMPLVDAGKRYHNHKCGMDEEKLNEKPQNLFALVRKSKGIYIVNYIQCNVSTLHLTSREWYDGEKKNTKCISWDNSFLSQRTIFPLFSWCFRVSITKSYSHNAADIALYILSPISTSYTCVWCIFRSAQVSRVFARCIITASIHMTADCIPQFLRMMINLHIYEHMCLVSEVPLHCAT